MSKEECEKAITKPEYVKALQDALTTELTNVIKTQLNGDYVTKYRPSIWCGSLVMQAVVETFASQLDKHYASGNALELQVDGKDLPFKVQSTSASTTINTSTSTTTVSTTTTKRATTKPALRTTTSGPTSTNVQDQAIEEDPSGIMIGVALTGSILFVAAVVLVVVIVCTKNNDGEKGKGTADEDVDTYHVTPKAMPDDPNQVTVEMVSSDVNYKKEDNQKAEVEQKPENENGEDADSQSTADNPKSTVVTV